MIHPDTELRKVSECIGYGVFATRFIPKGTIVYVKDELEIELSPEQYADLKPASRSLADWYSYIDPQGFRVISWDIAKYVNHSCRPNSISTGYGFEIAIKDIQPGEEITDEYGIFNLPRSMDCCCGCPDCRGTIRSDDWLVYRRKWDAMARRALACLNTVNQPLMNFLDQQTHQSLMRYMNRQERMRSVTMLRYVPGSVCEPVAKMA